LARLLGPVRAVAESRLLADPARRSLWGHSFGALFALYTLATRPEAFARYAAISPSVWWDAPLVNGLADQIRGGGQRLLLAVGDAEKHRGTPNAGAQTPAGPPPATMALGRRLAAVPGLEVTRAVYPGAAHIDSLTASLPQTLALAAQ
ncbi:MAG: alpha/beta hydrolase-fold protein, partial [Tepidimonas taiwanensis]|nr:alpha/beta hydrolase-fold protein [Tepidimonas taiwanensis]